MEVDGLIETIRDQGDLLAIAAEKAGASAAVPTCPEWCVRDLVKHQGEVHRWAAAIVRDQLSTARCRLRRLGRTTTGSSHGSDRGALTWSTCSSTLTRQWSASRSFPAPSPLAFWARRQAHETGIHRVDAESAVGADHAVRPGGRGGRDRGDAVRLRCARRAAGCARRRHDRSAFEPRDTDRSWVVQVGRRIRHRVPRRRRCGLHGHGGSVRSLHVAVEPRRHGRSPRSKATTPVLDLWQEKMRIGW